MVLLERQCWSNSQYSRRASLEISRLSESLKSEDLEGTGLKDFEELDVVVDPTNVEDYDWVGRRTSKKVIIRLSRRKDANQNTQGEQKIEKSKLSSLGIKTPVFINDSLCSYYKMLWSKYRKLSLNKLIHAFWN